MIGTFTSLLQPDMSPLAILTGISFNPRRECGHEVREKPAGRLVCYVAVGIKELRGSPDVCLGLLHCRDIQEHE